MNNALAHILCLFLAISLTTSCDWFKEKDLPAQRVFIMYAAAYSNLSESIKEDIEELAAGTLPVKRSGDIVMVYAHQAAPGNNVRVATESALYRIYKDKKGNTVRDTVQIYPSDVVSGSAETLHSVLNKVQELYPAPSYGLLFSSHAKGWLPVNYKETEISLFSVPSGPAKEYPLTKEIGIENAEGSGIDIRDFVDAIPMKLDYCIMDACLMGCVEVAYELKDKCNYLLVSPTEILSNGLIYSSMGPKLFEVQKPDLTSIAREYFEYYQAQSGYYQSATITLVDCRKLDALARACANIISAHRDGIEAAGHNKVQRYFYNNLHWFYDLQDLMAKSGADFNQMAALNEALANCIIYKAATEKFFDLKLENVCGLSIYYPSPDWSGLNAYYRNLAWNKATNLVQ